MVKLAVNAGSDLATVLRMATLNAGANYFRLYDLGAIALGYKADILVFDNLLDWQPSIVYKSGKLAARGKSLFHSIGVNDQNVRNTMHLGNIDLNSLKIPAKSVRARVIELVSRQLVTRSLLWKYL